MRKYGGEILDEVLKSPGLSYRLALFLVAEFYFFFARSDSITEDKMNRDSVHFAFEAEFH